MVLHQRGAILVGGKGDECEFRGDQKAKLVHDAAVRTDRGLPADEARRICELREHTGWSPRRIADEPEIRPYV